MYLPGVCLFTLLVCIGSKYDKWSSSPMVNKLEEVRDFRQNSRRQSMETLITSLRQRWKVTYLHWTSSSNALVFHSTAMSSHCFSSASLSSLNTFDNAAQYLPISFLPLSESRFCSSEMHSVNTWSHTDFAVQDLVDVGWPCVSDLDFAGLSSVPFPDA